MTDLKAFRRACYEAARRTGGELTERGVDQHGLASAREPRATATAASFTFIRQ
ncbi:hypothetical protein [Actinoplanes sp. ATCC 53533]|uniref:hypothetical protein n=1 Tax=Actinoplanes sp. ATCC 53533 TaxID=1288362 RepID=UPI001315036C|nr:hypothetical protein [Actinoplanes sp. ATCC 53533]